MPQKRKSRVAEVRDLVEACQQQVEDVWNLTTFSALSQKGYQLYRYLYGEISKEDSDDIIEEIATMGASLTADETMEDGGVPDLIVRDSQGQTAVLIEATGTATIEVREQGIMPEIEQFAQKWENERPTHKNQVRTILENLGLWPHSFSVAVTIIEV